MHIFGRSSIYHQTHMSVSGRLVQTFFSLRQQFNRLVGSLSLNLLISFSVRAPIIFAITLGLACKCDMGDKLPFCLNEFWEACIALDQLESRTIQIGIQFWI